MKSVGLCMRGVLVLMLLLMPRVSTARDDTAGEVVSILWQAMSHDPGGQADVDALRRIFHEDAVVFGGRYKEDAPVMQRSSVQEFLKAFERPGKKGFHECEVSRSLKIYDRFAVAYSVVESRFDKTARQADFVGVNSIQLYQAGSQWKILSLYYHVEKEGAPVVLEGGTPGQCLS